MLILDGESGASSLCFTADSSRLLIERVDGSAEAWAPASGERARLLEPATEPLRGRTLHRAGWALRATTSGTVAVASLSGDPPRTFSLPGDSLQLELSPDATWAVLVSHRAGRPRYVGYHCGPGLHFGNPAWGVEAFLPSARIGGFLAPGDRFVGIRGRRLVVYDTPTGKMHDVFPYPARYARCCAASADGSRFAAMGYDKLYLWDTTVWGAPRRVTGLNRWIHSMAFHPTRPLLLTSQNLLSLVKYLDADTGKPVRKFDWKLGEMGPVAFSPDGTLAAAGSRGGKIVVWDVEI